MRKWKTRAAPDDPNVWSDVSGMWPTTQGTYEVADIYGSPTTLTATGETPGSGLSAWGFNVLSGQRFYIVGTKIWELSGGTLTDRTGGITVAGGHMCQYGNVSVLARGTSNSLAVSTGGNFSALAGSPSANIVVTQSNALVAFNTSVSSDGWAASDVGDYTNWTTGEASSGRILDHNGPITAAVPFGNDIIVFKADAIFRMTYVGGTVKWQVQKVSEGVGCYDTNITPTYSAAEACGDCIIFLGVLGVSNQAKVYRFDGSAVPQLINYDTDIPGNTPMPCYDPANRRVFFMYYNAASLIPLYYALDSDSWGRGADLFSTVGQVRPLFMRGDHSAVVQVLIQTEGAALRDRSSTLQRIRSSNCFRLPLEEAQAPAPTCKPRSTDSRIGRLCLAG
jgi:hypothetical protein